MCARRGCLFAAGDGERRPDEARTPITSYEDRSWCVNDRCRGPRIVSARPACLASGVLAPSHAYSAPNVSSSRIPQGGANGSGSCVPRVWCIRTPKENRGDCGDWLTAAQVRVGRASEPQVRRRSSRRWRGRGAAPADWRLRGRPGHHSNRNPRVPARRRWRIR